MGKLIGHLEAFPLKPRGVPLPVPFGVAGPLRRWTHESPKDFALYIPHGHEPPGVLAGLGLLGLLLS